MFVYEDANANAVQNLVGLLLSDCFFGIGRRSE
jgi:hypothetical protein